MILVIGGLKYWSRCLAKPTIYPTGTDEIALPAYDEIIVQAFCEILASGGDVSPSGEDGLAALKMAMACDLSLKEGRPVAIAEVQP